MHIHPSLCPSPILTLLSTQAKILEHDNVNYLKKILGELGMVLDQIEAELEKRKLEYQGRCWAAFMGCFSTQGRGTTPGMADGFAPDERPPRGNHQWGQGCSCVLLVLGAPMSLQVLLASSKPPLLWGAPRTPCHRGSGTPVLTADLWELQSHCGVAEGLLHLSKGPPVTDVLADSGRSRLASGSCTARSTD